MIDPATGAGPYFDRLLRFQRMMGVAIDFHDGLSNMKSSEREGAITIKPSPVLEEQWRVALI